MITEEWIDEIEEECYLRSLSDYDRHLIEKRLFVSECFSSETIDSSFGFGDLLIRQTDFTGKIFNSYIVF